MAGSLGPLSVNYTKARPQSYTLLVVSAFASLAMSGLHLLEAYELVQCNLASLLLKPLLHKSETQAPCIMVPTKTNPNVQLEQYSDKDLVQHDHASAHSSTTLLQPRLCLLLYAW